MLCCWLRDAIKLRIKVKPNSKEQSIKEESDGSLVVRLKSPSVDGKANAELVRLLAERFDVRRSQVILVSGVSSRTKLVEIVADNR